MRWLLASWGSRGDLHPFLALGRGLMARGDEVTLVGHPEWSDETHSAGLRFVPTDEPMRDEIFQRHPEILSSRWGGIPSLHALVREVIAPGFPPLLAALLAEAPQHDAIIAHHFAFPGAIAAEATGKPWVTVTLAPGVIPSAYSLPGAQFGRAGKRSARPGAQPSDLAGGPAHHQPPRRSSRQSVAARSRTRTDPGCRLRSAFSIAQPAALQQTFRAALRRIGAARKSRPAFAFSIRRRPRWETRSRHFWLRANRRCFFTLGSTAARSPGRFYEDAAEACRRLRLRGLLLVGSPANRPQHIPPGVLAVDYAPYGLLMLRVRAAVHQCGIGTLSHALRAGLPSVAVPFAFDQPNNACRLEELGVAEVVRPEKRNATTLTAALEKLLAGPAVSHARKIGGRIRRGDGVAAACTILEETFSQSPREAVSGSRFP